MQDNSVYVEIIIKIIIIIIMIKIMRRSRKLGSSTKWLQNDKKKQNQYNND